MLHGPASGAPLAFVPDMSMPPITASALHEVLSSAFEAIRPRGCAHCNVPMPRHIPFVHEEANWWLGPLDECPHGCARFMGWLWLQYARRYRVMTDSPTGVTPTGVRPQLSGADTGIGRTWDFRS